MYRGDGLMKLVIRIESEEWIYEEWIEDESE